MNFRGGMTFTFRYHRWWQLWGRGYGAAQVVAYDTTTAVLHLRLFGSDGSLITHLPIMESAVRPFAVQEIDSAPIPEAIIATSDEAVRQWREEQARGIAGVFTVRLGEAVDLLFQTVDSRSDAPLMIETAYPIAENGYRSVRAITIGN